MGDIDEYWRTGFEQIEGWVDLRLLPFLKRISEAHLERNVIGNMAEIGVHHGRFLIALAHLARLGETSIGIDLFDSQELNIDGSGTGSVDRVRENLGAYGPPDARVVLIKADTLALTASERIDIVRQNGPFRLFSVDGGHTAEHVVNDLLFAQDSLSGGGVVLADDYYYRHWPGVTEGICQLFAHHSPRIKPFLFVHNKLFLANASWHSYYLRMITETFHQEREFKIVRMHGSEAVAI